jgi:hypothetical protein
MPLCWIAKMASSTRLTASACVDGFWHGETADEADGVEKREKEDDVRDGAVGEAQESPKRAEPAR